MNNILILTCKDKSEADKISSKLLELKLIACAKATPASSSFLWKGKVDSNEEIMLIMDSKDELFDEIEAEIEKLHSYDTFVLVSLPVSKVSKKAAKWLDDSIASS